MGPATNAEVDSLQIMGTHAVIQQAGFGVKLRVLLLHAGMTGDALMP
jgi:hypothetical protein